MSITPGNVKMTRGKLDGLVERRKKDHDETISSDPKRGETCLDCLGRNGLECAFFGKDGSSVPEIAEQTARKVIQPNSKVHRNCPNVEVARTLAAEALLREVDDNTGAEALSDDRISNAIVEALVASTQGGVDKDNGEDS